MCTHTRAHTHTHSYTHGHTRFVAISEVLQRQGRKWRCSNTHHTYKHTSHLHTCAHTHFKTRTHTHTHTLNTYAHTGDAGDEAVLLRAHGHTNTYTHAYTHTGGDVEEAVQVMKLFCYELMDTHTHTHTYTHTGGDVEEAVQVMKLFCYELMDTGSSSGAPVAALFQANMDQVIAILTSRSDEVCVCVRTSPVSSQHGPSHCHTHVYK